MGFNSAFKGLSLSNVTLYALKTAKEAYLSFIVMRFTANQWIRLRCYFVRTPGL